MVVDEFVVRVNESDVFDTVVEYKDRIFNFLNEGDSGLFIFSDYSNIVFNRETGCSKLNYSIKDLLDYVDTDVSADAARIAVAINKEVKRLEDNNVEG